MTEFVLLVNDPIAVHWPGRCSLVPNVQDLLVYFNIASKKTFEKCLLNAHIEKCVIISSSLTRRKLKKHGSLEYKRSCTMRFQTMKHFGLLNGPHQSVDTNRSVSTLIVETANHLVGSDLR